MSNIGLFAMERSGFCFGNSSAPFGSLGSRMVREAMRRSGSIMNAEILTDQPKERCEKRLLRAMGQITPPIEAPVAARPSATPRERTK